jgi:tripartite-type tricarboxylate transporter receptor subunit TctC
MNFYRLFVAFALSIGTAFAQNPGARVIRLVIPFAAGSYTDNVARIVSPAVGERLGTTIVVDNRPGGNGVIGADAVAKAAPDGRTFLMGGTSVNAVNPHVLKSLPYDPVRDLVPVVRLGNLPFMVLVNPTVPASTLVEFIAHAKANPGKLAYGTPNSTTLVGMETLKRLAGIDILSVPYKSSPQAMGDLAGGQLQVIIADFATAMPQVRSGRARMLAVTMARRSALLPEVPTVDETLKGFDISAWNAIFAPRATPRETIAPFAEAMESVLASREVRERLTGIGFDVSPLGGDAFADYARSQMAAWGGLIREAGVQPE